MTRWMLAVTAVIVMLCGFLIAAPYLFAEVDTPGLVETARQAGSALVAR